MYVITSLQRAAFQQPIKADEEVFFIICCCAI